MMDLVFFNKNVQNGKQFEAKVEGTNEKLRCAKKDDSTVFIYVKGSRKYGHYMNTADFLTKATPIIKTKEEMEKEWHSRCKKCEKRLEQSGLWPELKVIFHNLQKISYDDWIGMRRCGRHSDEAKAYISKYPFISSDGTDIDYDYTNELSYANCKSMFFGKGMNEHYKGQIKQALATRQPYNTGRIQLNYDVSFSFKPEKMQAWYSEEYRNCGNGHYYLALDESAAVFCEDD